MDLAHTWRAQTQDFMWLSGFAIFLEAPSSKPSKKPKHKASGSGLFLRCMPKDKDIESSAVPASFWATPA
ncbi:MAG: hypothetical protein EBZ44_04350 [Verrucomicrobia bacterium]|nr:hypothetical protein [Verrucomicrobiota bacterium]